MIGGTRAGTKMPDGEIWGVCNDDGDDDGGDAGWGVTFRCQASSVGGSDRPCVHRCLEMDREAAKRRLQQLKKGVVMARVIALNVIVAVVSYRPQAVRLLVSR